MDVSITQKISCDSIAFLGLRRALLMQAAHPAVAKAVKDHSRFPSDPITRLYNTANFMVDVTCAPDHVRERAITKVVRIHEHINGTMSDGRPYSAADPALLIWVYATLIESIVVVYEKFVRELTREEKNQYVLEMNKRLAIPVGIPEDFAPREYCILTAYIDDMLMWGKVGVTRTTHDIAKYIIYPITGFPLPFSDTANLITRALLPRKIREIYGLSLSDAERFTFGLLVKAVRGSRSYTPSVLWRSVLSYHAYWKVRDMLAGT